MPYVLARLGSVLQDGRRVVHVRGREILGALPTEAPSPPEDALVLVDGPSPPWRTIVPVQPVDWPDGLGRLDIAWRTGHTRLCDVSLSELITVSGLWCLDPRGVPCELAQGRAGGPVAWVANYTGWRLCDLASARLDVEVVHTPAGTTWIVPPQATGNASPAPDERFAGRSRPPLGEDFAAPRSPTAPPSRQVVPTRFEARIPWRDVTFSDRSISFEVRGRTFWAALPSARPIHQELVDDLEAELPGGLLATCTVHPDGSTNAELHDPTRFSSLFEAVERRCFVRTALAEDRWIDATELAERQPGAHTSYDPVSLLDIPEFGLAHRAEAWRRLFRRRDAGRPILMLPGRAALVPLPASDAEAGWYAWEVVEEDHATYLFRPEGDEELDALLDWTADLRNRRKDLLGDPELQRRLRFVCRVHHVAAREDALGGWWSRLCAAIGLPPDEPE